MSKSSTIWVSMKTKKKANRLKGDKSYNQFFWELMEKNGSYKGSNGDRELERQIENLVTRYIEKERVREIIREEMEKRMALSEIKYSPVRNRVRKKSIFSMLV